MKIKLSGVVAAVSWLSFFLMVWMLFCGTFEYSTGRYAAALLLLCIACFS